MQELAGGHVHIHGSAVAQSATLWQSLLEWLLQGGQQGM